MPSFLMCKTDRLVCIGQELEVLEAELHDIWKEIEQTLTSRVGKELFDALERCVYTLHETTLIEVILSQKFDESHKPGQIVFNLYDLEPIGFQNFTEVLEMIRMFELAWFDFLFIRTEFESASPGEDEHLLRVRFHLPEYERKDK